MEERLKKIEERCKKLGWDKWKFWGIVRHIGEMTEEITIGQLFDAKLGHAPLAHIAERLLSLYEPGAKVKVRHFISN